nr:LacI family DNA-binding transcriptional regulator [Peribacillus glennii]
MTIKDIARELNVSTATVSRVLNQSGYASLEVKRQVLAAAKKMNYQPNAIARSLKKHQTKTIGVILPDISNPYFMKISKGLEDVVYESGYHLIFSSGNDNPEKENEMLKVLFEKRVDAIVLAPSGENDELIHKIKNTGIPVILVDRQLSNEAVGLDYVTEDNFEGAYQLTSYLLEQGHKQIGVVNGPLSISTGFERYEGFRSAIKRYNIEVDHKYIYHGDYTQEAGYKAAKYFFDLAEKPTAILSFNNRMTFGVLLELAERGLSNYEHLDIASYGETEATIFLKAPKIITLHHSSYEMGARVGEILMEKLVKNKEESVNEKPKQHTIYTQKSTIWQESDLKS